MFTDTVGYSALMQKNEALALEWLDEQKQLLHPIFSQYNGHIIKPTGDGFLVEFASAVEAVRCAIAMQKAVTQRNDSSPVARRVAIRIGIHVGDVVFREGDVFGDGVNIAARIEPLAGPGGICISEQVYDQVRNKIEEPIVSLGKRALKNIQEPLEIYKVELIKPQAKADTEEPKSIAVLPFVNMSADPENEYFSDGITEELIDALAKVEGLKVISRTSVFHLKGKDLDLRTIGQKLNVSTVVEGSVRKAGDRVRITAQLINVADDAHLWAEKYDRQMGDIFAVQDEIARTIVGALQIKLLPKSQLVKRPTENLEVYQLYLKGRYFWNKRTEEGLKKGIEYFEQAIERDPTYALAYAGLADSYQTLAWWGYLPAKEAFPRGKAAAMKALEIDDTLAEAHASLAYASHHHDWDWLVAEREFKRALELNPGYATAHHWYALYLAALGQFDEAIAEIKRAQELDPLSLVINTTVGYPFYFARQYDRAIEQFRKTLDLDPNFIWAHFWLGLAYVQKGMYKEAIAEFGKAITISGSTSLIVAALGYTYALSGKRDEALKVLDELKELSTRRYVSSSYLAAIYCGLGDKEQAFAWLEKAYEERANRLAYLKVEPMFDSLRSDPKFTELLKKMGLEK